MRIIDIQDIYTMIDTDFLDGLARFNLVVKKKVTSSYTGANRSKKLGSGTELADIRKYEQGDDTRQIDWNMFARSEKLYIKRFEEEKNLTVHIIVDSSKSMDFGKGKTKFEFSSMLGVGFAYLAMRNNERFEFSTFSSKLDVFKAKRGMGHLAKIIDHLNKKKVKGNSKFTEMMGQYRKLIKSKSLVIVVSDFLYDLDDIKTGLLQFSNHDIRVIQVLDKEEKELPLLGDVKLEDSETNTQLRTYLSKKMRFDYINKLNYHSDLIGNYVESLKGRYYSIATNEEIFDAFYHMLV